MNELHLYLSGEIAPDSENFVDPTTGARVIWGTNWLVSELRSKPDASKIVLHINSPGGDVSEGFAMHDILSQLTIPLEAIVEGRCASIATVVALAAPVRKITANSTWFIHNPWGEREGDAATFRRAADELQAVEDVIAQFYAEKTGKKLAELETLMQSETEFTAEQAKDYGFATEVVPTVRAKAFINLTNNMSKDTGLLDRVLNTLQSLRSNFSGAKAADYATKDGETLQIQTTGDTPAVGDAVSLNGSPAPNKDYQLASGDTITVVDGKITAFTPAAAPAQMPAPAADAAQPTVVAVSADQFNTLVNTVNTLATEVKALSGATSAKQKEQDEILEKTTATLELIGTTMGSQGFKKLVNKQTFSEDAEAREKAVTPEEQKAAAIKASRERRLGKQAKQEA